MGRQIVAESETHTGQDEFHGSLPKGTRLRNYEVVSVLGHGAFGITYQARDTTLGRTVAIKEYLPTMLALRDGQSIVIPRSTELAEDFTWGRDRFLEEARILVTLDGVPSVVRVHDFLEANGTAYMVMALVRGETLERRLKRDRTLPAPVVEKLLHRLLDGLEQVHEAGFLHRDIKPANIILDADDNPTLIDFGASRASMADRTSAMTAIFTPRYAAVEQLGSDRQGPWTDIYGLSVTLHYAVTGRAPPTAMERLSSDGYEPLSRLQPAGFAPALLRGIDAGLGLRAADRPQSIASWRTVFASAAERSSDATVVRSRKPPSPPARQDTGQQDRGRQDRSKQDGAHRDGAQPPPTPPQERAAGRSRGMALAIGGVAAACVLAVGGYFLAGSLRSDGASPSASSQGVAVAPSDLEAARAQAEQRKAEEAARQKAAAEETARAQAEQRRAEEAVRQKAAAEEAARVQAERQKAEEAARQKAAAEEAARVQAERQKAEEAARQKAVAEEAARAQAERQKAEEAARQKAAAEEAARVQAARAQAEQQKAEEVARQKAAAEEAARVQAERQKAEEAARQKAAAEEAARVQAARAQAEQQKAEEAARQKAAAEEAARQASTAQAGEAALGLTSGDRQRLQFALTSLGFDTRGSDGVFGPRSREMIAAWQKQRGLLDTGYLSGEQRADLLREGASGVAKGLAEQAEQAKKVTTKSSDASPPALPADQRCRTILQKAQLTGALGDDDRAYLKERCR